MPEPNLPDDGRTRKSNPPAPPATPNVAKTAPTGTWNPADEADVELAAPQRIGRFEVRAVLGTGTYGRVFLAFDPLMHRQVAIKQPFGEGLKPEYREDFLKEARAVAPLAHANICQVFDVSSEGELPFIVMRFVAGGTLKNYLERRTTPLAPCAALVIIRKIAMGLTAAHAQGVIHRDLKPANVLVDDANSEVLITDFGLARIANRAQAAMSQAAVSLQRGAHGTPYYMPPEQWGSQAFGPITPLADVYSLGIMLYEMLAGEVPFTGAPFELMTRHCTEPPRPPSSIRPGLDSKLDALCLKAIEKMPANRYRSAKEFTDAISDYLRGGDVDLVEPLPLGEELNDPAPPRQPLPWAQPIGAPQQPAKRPGTSPHAASTASQPDSTIDEKEIVRCPKCNARLEIGKGRTKPVDCPMCALKFAVEAGRQTAARASRAAEKENPTPVAQPTRRKEKRRDEREERDDRDERRERKRRREEEEDNIPPHKWQPAARGLRLVWIGMLLCTLCGAGLGVTLLAMVGEESSRSSSSSSSYSSEKSTKNGYSSTPPVRSNESAYQTVCTFLGLGLAGGIFVIGVGRFMAARVPSGVPGRGVATLSAICAWGEAGCLAVLFVLLGIDDSSAGSRAERMQIGIAVILGGAAVLMLLASEFASNSYLTAIGREIRRGFPRTLPTTAKVFLWVILSCAIIGASAAGIATSIDDKKTSAVTFLAVITGGSFCLTLVVLPFWGFVTLWLNIHAAVVVSRHANSEVYDL